MLLLRSIQALTLLSLTSQIVADANDDSFLQWFESNGGKLHSVTVHQFEGMGRGVLATEDLKPKDLVIELPKSLLLTRSRAVELAETQRLKSMLKGVRQDEDAIAAILMREKSLGSHSEWAPYLGVLPTAISQAALMDEETLALSNDPAFIHRARRRGAELDDRFERLAPLFEAIDSEIQLLHEGLPSCNDRELYRWAHAVLSSRALTFRGKRVLTPVVDMFNYQPHPSPREAASGEFYLEHHEMSDAGLKVYADRLTLKGNQLFEDYGDNPSSLYMDHHGFLPDTNPFDCASIELIPPVDALTPTRNEIAAMLHMGLHRSECVRSIDDGDVSWVAYLWLRLHTMSQPELHTCLAIMKKKENNGTREGSDCPFVHPAPHRAFPPPGWVPSKQERALLTSFMETALARHAAAVTTTTTTTTQSEEARMMLRYSSQQRAMLQAMLAELSAHKPSHGDVVEISSDGSLLAVEKQQQQQQRYRDCAAELADYEERLECFAVEFNQWLEDQSFPVIKLAAKRVPGMRIGAVATEPITRESVYLSVPNDAIMSSASAAQSPHLATVSQLVRSRSPPREADFYLLLFHLLYERFKLGNQSRYWPYLQLLPTLEEIHPPVEYTQAEMEVLKPSSVHASILAYKQEVDRHWRWLQEFEEIISPVFGAMLDESQFRWAHYVLNSRSIWWSGVRHLVPMLDLINCKELSDVKRVHSTVLDESGKHAITKAPDDFRMGDQVYENYGQPNHIYFQYHGFVLDSNTHDCVSLTIPIERNDPGATNLAELREGMRRFGFTKGVQSFCVSERVNERTDRRLAVWLSLKYAKQPGADVTAEFQDLIRERVAEYPPASQLQSQSLTSMPHKLLLKELQVLQSLLHG